MRLVGRTGPIPVDLALGVGQSPVLGWTIGGHFSLGAFFGLSNAGFGGSGGSQHFGLMLTPGMGDTPKLRGD